MAHRGPADLAHVEQAVRAADVHKGAEGPQAAHHALHHIPHLQGLEELGLLLLSVLPFGQALGEDQPAATAIHLDHLDRHLLPHSLGELLETLLLAQGTAQVLDVGGGDEAPQVPELHQQAALVVAHHFAHGDLAGLQHPLRRQPVLLLQGLGDAQEQHAFLVVRAGDHHRDLLPLVQVLHEVRWKLLEIRLGHHTVSLGANVDQDLGGPISVPVDVDNDPFPQVALLRELEALSLLQELGEEGFVRFLLGLFRSLLRGLGRLFRRFSLGFGFGFGLCFRLWLARMLLLGWLLVPRGAARVTRIAVELFLVCTKSL